MVLLASAVSILLVQSVAALPRIIVVGDSITANIELLRAANEWPNVVAHHLNAIVLVHARPGAHMATFADTRDVGMIADVSTLTRLNLVPQISAIVILLGVNDWLHGVPLADFRRAYTDFVGGTAYRIKTVCVTPIPQLSEAVAVKGHFLDEYRAVIRDVCKPGIVVEGADLIPADSLLYATPSHPNDTGSRRLGMKLAKVLKPLMLP